MNRSLTGFLCLALAGSFLIVGWWPFSPFPPNHVSWLGDRSGLAFQPNGIVHDSGRLLPASVSDGPDNFPGFTLEISLEAGLELNSGVPHILTIDDGLTPSRLVLGQWKSELLLRTPSLRYPDRHLEIGVSALQKQKSRIIFISSDSSGTTFYVDGILADQSPNFVLPPNSLRGRLILGDAATGQQSWTGKLFGVALFNRALDSRELTIHHSIWAKGAESTLSNEPGLVALYPFDEGSGSVVRDLSSNRNDLIIPSRYRALRKTVLEFSRLELPVRSSMVQDIALNLLGFVPFGFLAFQFHRRSLSSTGFRAAAFGTLTGAMLSLTIEIGQVWLPNRNSSTADLVFNTAGSVLGVLMARFFFRKKTGDVDRIP